jgi:hypothetical protein
VVGWPAEVGWPAAGAAGCPAGAGCSELWAVRGFWLGADELFGLHPLNESVTAKPRMAKRASGKWNLIWFIPFWVFPHTTTGNEWEFLRKEVNQNK